MTVSFAVLNTVTPLLAAPLTNDYRLADSDGRLNQTFIYRSALGCFRPMAAIGMAAMGGIQA
jgi:hypothetical protein